MKLYKYLLTVLISLLLLFSCSQDLSEDTREVEQLSNSRRLDFPYVHSPWHLITKYIKGFGEEHEYIERVYSEKLGKELTIVRVDGNAAPHVPEHITTSEAMGFGMRLAIYGWRGFPSIQNNGMLQARNEFKKVFDDLLRTQSLFTSKSYGVEGLHSCVIPKSLDIADGSTSATDGELEIAYAVIEAYKLWGGNWYREKAVSMLNGISNHLIAHKTMYIDNRHTYLKVGDWTRWCKKENAPDHTRPSYWAPNHFRAFIGFLEAEGLGSSETAVSFRELLEDTERAYAYNNWGSGLFPELVYIGNRFSQYNYATDAFLSLMGEESHGKRYSWNSCRIPLRLAMDVLNSGNRTSEEALNRIYRTMNWSSNVFNETGSLYYMNGTVANSKSEVAFAAPIAASLVGPMLHISSPSQGAFYDKKRQNAINELAVRFKGNSGSDGDYYSDAILIFSMLALQGNERIISRPF